MSSDWQNGKILDIQMLFSGCFTKQNESEASFTLELVVFVTPCCSRSHWFLHFFRTARLQLTDELIGDLDVSSEADDANKDVQRIQELLTLPQNEDVTQQSSSQ